MRLAGIIRDRRVKRASIMAFAMIFVAFGLVVGTYPVIWLGSVIAPKAEPWFSVPKYTYLYRNPAFRGEPINLVVVGYDLGTEATLNKMGWVEVRGLMEDGIVKAIQNLRKGITPVSERFLFGRKQDAAFQGPDSTIFKRHHLRMWRRDLPDGTSAWYIAASFDRTLGASFTGKLAIPTHIIAPNIDTERDSLGRALAEKLGGHAVLYDNILPVLYRSNGDNSWFYTDGEVMVIAPDGPSVPEQSGWRAVKHDYFLTLTSFLRLFEIAE